ncbi:YqcC family protein [Ferruginibacter sp.]
MDQITDKVTAIKNEMKLVGLWKKQLPAWVNEYNGQHITTEQDFTGWLQFIYLPNIMQPENRNSMSTMENHIVPQAMKFFGEDIQKGRLLQLLVELDSLV